MKTRAGTIAGLTAAATAITFSMFVTVTAHSDPPPEPAPPSTTQTAPPPPNPEGSGCDAYKQANPTGKGSFTGMANAPMADALASDPMLTTFNAAISGQFNPAVNLVSTLNTGDHIVFAPVDDAFAQLPPEKLNALKSDPTALANLLNYHVVLGLLYPGDVHGKLTTLQGSQVTVKGSGGDIKLDDVAKVVCGGIRTKNGVIYMIDTVLDPATSPAASPTSTTPTTPTSTPSSTSPTSTTTTTPPPPGR
jgi:uncharacterized surface protein with fasciclin (FAS1) repeats